MQDSRCYRREGVWQALSGKTIFAGISGRLGLGGRAQGGVRGIGKTEYRGGLGCIEFCTVIPVTWSSVIP